MQAIQSKKKTNKKVFRGRDTFYLSSRHGVLEKIGELLTICIVCSKHYT